MNMRVQWLATGILAIVVAAGCATTGTAGEGFDRYRLTNAEIHSVDVLNLYDVVHRLRPRWLEVRAPRSGLAGGSAEHPIMVYLNNTRLGGVAELRRFSPNEVDWLEYLDGPEAQARLSGIHSQNIEGAIVIHLPGSDRR